MSRINDSMAAGNTDSILIGSSIGTGAFMIKQQARQQQIRYGIPKQTIQGQQDYTDNKLDGSRIIPLCFQGFYGISGE